MLDRSEVGTSDIKSRNGVMLRLINLSQSTRSMQSLSVLLG
jgi:hypothetical protein